MNLTDVETPAAWRVEDLDRDRDWTFEIDPQARKQLAAAVREAFVPDRPLFDYSRENFDLGPAGMTIAAAFRQVQQGRGFALVRGLPRDELTEAEFEMLNWAIGLHSGVARPQGRATQYISAVKDVGTDYRGAGGRGYSSNAKLDFHVDGCDVVTLACYNRAKSGGQSMVTSAVTARRILIAERPDLAEVAHGNFCFSRQSEQAPDEGAFYAQPLFEIADGRLFTKWNRNRAQAAQKITGVPPMTDKQRETLDVMDGILQRPGLMFTMYLEPGDLQLLNNHVMLHSRTEYVDFDEPERKRQLFRLWLAPPDSPRLPDSWGDFFRSVEAGSVRGGIRGHYHDAACRAFERRQAASLGMTVGGTQ
jgi:hypothetical protein